jgi:hypothetical protein
VLGPQLGDVAFISLHLVFQNLDGLLLGFTGFFIRRQGVLGIECELKRHFTACPAPDGEGGGVVCVNEGQPLFPGIRVGLGDGGIGLELGRIVVVVGL